MKTATKLVVLALAALGCHAEKPRRTAPVIARLAADAAVAGRVDGSTLALARAARDAATEVAMQCRLHSSYEDNSVRYSDYCSWEAAQLEPMRAASSALIAASPDAGDVIVFIEHVRLFMEWVELAKSAHAGGTLAHYQDLALAWNALQPQDPIAVDVHAPDKYGRPPDAGASGHLEWQRCGSGPCVVVITSR